MPNLFAHNLLVKRFYIKEDEEKLDYSSSFIKGNFDFLALGSQGPDPLFYVGIIPFHAPHLLTAKKRLGNKIHKTDGKKFFRLLVERCYIIEDLKEKACFQSFVFGQFAHYLLDREAHPYIIYESGFDEDGKIKGKYHYEHAHFEEQIDALLAKKFKMTYFLSNPGEVLCKREDALKLIDKNLVPVLKKFFSDEKIPNKIYTCAIKNMHSAIAFMNHHGKIKSKIVGKNNLGALYIDADKADPKVLNSDKEAWLDPVTGSSHHESFLELHSRAYDILVQCYYDILKNGFYYEVFSRYLNGLDYYGLPVGSKWTYKKQK